MSDTPITDSIRKQTKKELNLQLNNLILETLEDLPSQSPQYTGFFASSWQANTYRPLSNEPRTAPWTKVKNDRDNGIKTEPKIEPRYSLDREFKFGETVFIGNRAEYARQALGSESSKVLTYMETLIQKIDPIFSQKGDVRIASSQVLYKDAQGGRDAAALGSKYKKL
jgi:hypothetical protein